MRQGSSGAAMQRGRGDNGGVACGRQVHGWPVGVPRRRRGASPSACRGALDDGRRDGMGGRSAPCGRAHSSGEGVSGARPGSRAASGSVQRRSERQRRAERSGQGRVSEEEREEREKGSGERNLKVHGLT